MLRDPTLKNQSKSQFFFLVADKSILICWLIKFQNTTGLAQLQTAQKRIHKGRHSYFYRIFWLFIAAPVKYDIFSFKIIEVTNCVH